MKVAKQLAKQAKQLNICQEWHDELKTLTDKQKMAEMYLRGIDFCLANDFPSNDYIKANFSDVINDFGIYLDSKFETNNPDKCVLLGNANGVVNVDGFAVSEIYAKHDSTLTLNVGDNAFVMVDIFDTAGVYVTVTGNAKVCINLYGNAEVWKEIHDFGVVKVINKHKKTY